MTEDQSKGDKLSVKFPVRKGDGKSLGAMIDRAEMAARWTLPRSEEGGVRHIELGFEKAPEGERGHVVITHRHEKEEPPNEEDVRGE
jgi:hypothetical protein